MKPAELFPGAVCLLDGSPVVLNSVSSLWVTIGPGTMTLAYHRDELSPLPLSPAVLVGLGLESRHKPMVWQTESFSVVVHKDGACYIMAYTHVIEHAHQLQALALHLYGVELEWDAEKYEKAMKEEQ